MSSVPLASGRVTLAQEFIVEYSVENLLIHSPHGIEFMEGCAVVFEPKSAASQPSLLRIHSSFLTKFRLCPQLEILELRKDLSGRAFT